MNTARMTVAQITSILNRETLPPETIEALEKDERVTVARMLAKWRSEKIKIKREYDRIIQLYQYENNLRIQGHCLIAGIDEAGRGPLAGPVVIGCVALPYECHLPYLNDSKKLTVKQREELYEKIKEKALAVHSIVIETDIIDKMNIYQATKLGMYSVLDQMDPQPDAVLIDAVPLPDLTITNKSIIGGDALSASIAAASIIAKVERDRIMDELDKTYPVYGFAQHKGYATSEHIRAIQHYGPCAAHRKTFEPIKSWRGSNENT